jgi:threonine dehydrogenase-like Zn-dependent dehydrogenase
MNRPTFPESMSVLQLHGPNDLREGRLPVPRPRADELLVRTAAATICTSDLIDIRSNSYGIVLPRVLGHEGAGTVVGIGDRVAAHPVIPCGQCEECQRGIAHLCRNMGHLGLDRDGVFAEYFTIRADRARRLPDKVP